MTAVESIRAASMAHSVSWLSSTGAAPAATSPGQSWLLFEHDAAGLLARASDGDREAWDRLFSVFGGMIWSIARRQGLSPTDAEDVAQNTWLRLVEHLHRIEQPERVAGWIATTTRRECTRLLKERQKRLLVADEDLERIRPDGADADAEPGARMLADELAGEVSAAYDQLPSRCKTMLGPLGAEQARSYRELSLVLDMPFGSIGPTRQRCIACLRRLMESQPAARSPMPVPMTAAGGADGLRQTA